MEESKESEKKPRATRGTKTTNDKPVEKVTTSDKAPSKVLLRYSGNGKTTERTVDAEQYKKIEKMFEKSIEKTLNPKPVKPRVKKETKVPDGN